MMPKGSSSSSTVGTRSDNNAEYTRHAGSPKFSDNGSAGVNFNRPGRSPPGKPSFKSEFKGSSSGKSMDGAGSGAGHDGGLGEDGGSQEGRGLYVILKI